MRPIWSGTISFGLVSVPVRMFPATESKELRFHFLHKEDLSPIAYEKELLELIRAKAEGQPLPEPEQAAEAEVVDLMAALRESVERTKKQRRKPSKRKAS
jgi:non-homologous end joining protein Ku